MLLREIARNTSKTGVKKFTTKDYLISILFDLNKYRHYNMFAGIYNELVKKYSYLISDRRILNNEKVIKIQILTSALIVNLLLAVTQNQIKKELGVFKTGQFLLCPSVQLPSPDAIPGESGEGVDVTGIEIIVI